MITWFMNRRLDNFERAFDYDASYMREMLRLSPIALMRFMQATSLSKFRKGVPLEVWYAASLMGIVAEDCGPCTQLGVTMAERAGVDPKLIANLIAGRFDALPGPVADTARFAIATLRRSAEADELRQRVEKHFGRIGLLSIALAITTSRMYPTIKYALGYGHACQRVTVNGKTVAPGAGLKLLEPLEGEPMQARAV